MSVTSNFFQISPYFTFRWVDNDLSSPYNTDPLESTQDDLNYFQQIQCGGSGFQADTGQIHVLSSFVPTCKIYDYVTDQPVQTVALTPLNPPILGVNFIYYIGEVDFSSIPPGLYYGKITYVDENSTHRDWRTSPLDVQIFHDGTQLIEATNSYNDKGAVFTNPATQTYNWAKFRVASLIRQPLVKTDAQDYEDQYNDLTQETSIPFVVYTQCIGGPILLPFWVIEKINLLYSLDSVLIDGQPFAKLANSDFKPTRADVQPQGAWWEVDIQPNYSYPAEIYVQQDPGPDTFREIKMEKTYTNVSANFAATGIFTALTNLVRVAINNVGGNAFTLKIGTSQGDDSIASFDIPVDFDDSIDVGKLFVVPTDVWFSGLAGTNITLILDYNNYLAPVIPIAPTSGAKWVKNTIYYFLEVDTNSFANEFDVATGLGRTGTDHEGCVLIGSASDSLPNYKELLLRIWDVQEIPPIATRQTIIGENEVNIAGENLPQHQHFVANGDTLGGGGGIGAGQTLAQSLDANIKRDYILVGSTTPADRGATSPYPANGDPHDVPLDVTNRALILPAFYYVGI